MATNPVADSIKDLMVVACVIDVREFLKAVANALDESTHTDEAKLVRVIIDPPEQDNLN
ncbi:MAG: hypothetical protein WCN95_06760 [bacterium]